jgi:hypothetical protein
MKRKAAVLTKPLLSPDAVSYPIVLLAKVRAYLSLPDGRLLGPFSSLAHQVSGCLLASAQDHFPRPHITGIVLLSSLPAESPKPLLFTMFLRRPGIWGVEDNLPTWSSLSRFRCLAAFSLPPKAISSALRITSLVLLSPLPADGPKPLLSSTFLKAPGRVESNEEASTSMEEDVEVGSGPWEYWCFKPPGDVCGLTSWRFQS